jgi:hypothetical protein
MKLIDKTMLCANCDKTIVLDNYHPVINKLRVDYHLETQRNVCRTDDGSLMADKDGFFLVTNRGEE